MSGTDQKKISGFAAFRKNLSIFISHSNKDTSSAFAYCNLLKKVGFDNTWTYEERSHFGEDIEYQIKKQIRSCDFFILLVSPEAMSSAWVQRELGLARDISCRNNQYEPIILPIKLVKTGSQALEQHFGPFPCRDFDTGAESESYPLDKVRVFDEASPLADRVDDLIAHMTPQLQVVGRDIKSATELCELDFFELYEPMFPWEERVPREQIFRIFFDRPLRKPIPVTLPVHSRFSLRRTIRYTLNEESVMTLITLNNRTIGLMWICYYPERKYFFGNYLAIHRCWRSERMARTLLESFSSQINKDSYYNGYNGIIFEVETVDFEKLEEIIGTLEQTGASDISEDDAKVIRKFLRLVLYERSGCYLFMDESGVPLNYFQPCLDIEKPASEWETSGGVLWLMFNPLKQGAREFARTSLRWSEIVDLVVMEVEAKCYAADNPRVGDQFMRYAKSVRDRSIADSKGRQTVLGKMIKSDHISKLHSRWLKLDINIEL